ncbi:MAG: hypothetical protein WC675_04265 [Patescibacteria group bacterium]|jgi:hypothetical protein
MFLKKINLITIIALLLFNFLLADISQASVFEQIMKGFSTTGDKAGYALSGQAPAQEFVPAFMAYINSFLAIIAALFMVLIIYGGYLWMNARGREEQVERAKKLILGAVIGMAIILGGRMIAELALFVLNKTLPT